MNYKISKLIESIFLRTSESLTVKDCTYRAGHEGLEVSGRTMDRYLDSMEELRVIECINPGEKPKRYKAFKTQSIMTKEEALLIYPYIKHGGSHMPKRLFGHSSIKKAEQALQLLEELKAKNPQGKVAKWLTCDELIDECSNVKQAELARTFNNALFDNDELMITYSVNSEEVSEMIEPDGIVFLNENFHLRGSPINGFKVRTIKLSDVINIESVCNFEPPVKHDLSLRQAA
jgi:hypothetical protein